MHEDRAGSPAPRVFLQVVLDHHEVEALEKALVHVEALIAGDLKHIGHRIPVTSQCLLRLLLCREGGFVFHCSYDIVERGVVALDAVGALNRSCKGHPAERSRPASGLGHPVPELLALLAEEFKDLFFVFLQIWGFKNHDICKVSSPKAKRYLPNINESSECSPRVSRWGWCGGFVGRGKTGWRGSLRGGCCGRWGLRLICCCFGRVRSCGGMRRS